MGLDASIYQSMGRGVPQIESGDAAGALAKGMNLRRMAQENQERDYAVQSREQAAQKEAHLKKAAVFGTTLESMAGMSDEERAANWPKAREQLVQDGIMGPTDIPEGYDKGYYRSNLFKSRQSEESIAKQLKMAQINHLNAQSAKDQMLAKGAEDPSKILPADKVLALSEGRQVPKLLSELRSTVDENRDTFGPVAGRLAAANPWNEKAKTVDAQVRTVRQTIGKLKEGGVLRAEDEIKYAKMLPELSDTPEVAMNKLALVEREMSAKMNGQIADLGRAGYNMKGFADADAQSPELPGILRGGSREGAQAAPAPQAAPPAIKHGTVVDGYVYMGGDRANPKSWKKR